MRERRVGRKRAGELEEEGDCVDSRLGLRASFRTQACALREESEAVLRFAGACSVLVSKARRTLREAKGSERRVLLESRSEERRLERSAT